MKASLRVVSMMLAMGLAGSGAGAETDRYPVKPIRMVVPFTPGGVRERLLTLGVVPLSGTPEALGDYLQFEIARWAKLIREAGIKAE